MYETEFPATFLGSSAVEQSAVNRLVIGSNPTRGDSSKSTSVNNSYSTNWVGWLRLPHMPNQIALNHDPPTSE